VIDAQIGGDIYNETWQWGLREMRAVEADQFGKPEELKKPALYYSTLYDVNSTNSHFVEKATYWKWRELAVTYTFDRRALSGLFGRFLEKLSIGAVGRNVLTLTDYRGYDPEAGTFGYPNFRTLAGVIEFEF